MTWTLDRPIEVNREGNLIATGFLVAGLPVALVPSIDRSIVNATVPTVLGTECRVGSAVRSRTSQTNGRLSYRGEDDREPPQQRSR